MPRRFGVVCNSIGRFRKWCLEHPELAGVYDSVRGRAANARHIRTAGDVLLNEPTEFVCLEPTFDWELHSYLGNRKFLDKPAVEQRRRPGRPPKSQRPADQDTK